MTPIQAQDVTGRDPLPPPEPTRIEHLGMGAGHAANCHRYGRYAAYHAEAAGLPVASHKLLAALSLIEEAQADFARGDAGG